MKTTLGIAQLVKRRVRESIAVKEAILENESLLDLVQEVAGVCVRSLKQGGKLLFFGNGGSAADAEHLAAELVGRYSRERRALPAVSLTANSSCLTAIGNDYSYELVFSRQIEAFGNKGDIAIGISTSGNSPNVVRALRVAKGKGMITAAMTGKTGGTLKALVDYCLRIPSTQTARIQEGHILVGHVLCEIIEESLANEGRIP
jgi:D-sedoheptulose 7-phosphate isomerase